MFSLNINYSKYVIIPMGCKEDDAIHLAKILICKLLKMLVMHLGIPLRANPRKVSTWKPMIEKIDKRIA